MNKKPSKFAPIFIASTVVFFLGSAFKFIFGQKSDIEESSASMGNQTSLAQKNESAEVLEDDEFAQEPDEDPVQSL